MSLKLSPELEVERRQRWRVVAIFAAPLRPGKKILFERTDNFWVVSSEKMDIGIENKLQVNLGEDIEANVCRTRIFIKSLIKILHSNAVQGVYLSKCSLHEPIREKKWVRDSLFPQNKKKSAFKPTKPRKRRKKTVPLNNHGNSQNP